MWYVLQTAPNREWHVAQSLEARGVATYLPRFPVERRTRSGSVRDRRPRWLFPGYLFFSVPADFGGWQQICWMAGVRRLLFQDRQPARVADSAIERLRERLRSGLLHPPGQRFRPNEPLIVESGPLAAVDAVFDRELDGWSRVQILVHMMGRPVPVSIDRDHIRSIAG